jgi:hypothetical protein
VSWVDRQDLPVKTFGLTEPTRSVMGQRLSHHPIYVEHHGVEHHSTAFL